MNWIMSAEWSLDFYYYMGSYIAHFIYGGHIDEYDLLKYSPK